MECQRCCIACEKHKNRKQCENYKERRRATKLRVNQTKKANKLCSGDSNA